MARAGIALRPVAPDGQWGQRRIPERAAKARAGFGRWVSAPYAAGLPPVARACREDAYRARLMIIWMGSC